MSLNLEFYMLNGQVVTFDSQAGDASNNPDLAGIFTVLDCSDMHESGITMDQYALTLEGENVRISNSVLILEPDDVRHTYKAVQNNRDFMLMGEEGYLLNPTETQMMLDDMAAIAASGPDADHYAEIIEEQAQRNSADAPTQEAEDTDAEELQAESTQDTGDDLAIEDPTVDFDESSLF